MMDPKCKSCRAGEDHVCGCFSRPITAEEQRIVNLWNSADLDGRLALRTMLDDLDELPELRRIVNGLSDICKGRR